MVIFHLQQQQQPFYGPCSGLPGWAGARRNSPTHHPGHHPIFISFFHLPRSIASSLFKLLQNIFQTDSCITRRTPIIAFKGEGPNFLSWCGEIWFMLWYHTTTPQPFYGPFAGPPGWAGARRELLDFMVQGEINRGRHTGCIKMPLGMDVGLSTGDFVFDGDPVPPPQKGGGAPQIFGPCLLCLAILMWRGYMPAPRFTICVLVIIEFGLNILRNPVTLLTLFVLKIHCSMVKVTVTITSFKNIVAYRRSALNLV